MGKGSESNRTHNGGQARRGSMSRRSFLAGGAAMGTAALGAGLLASCSPSSSTASAGDKSATGVDENGNVKAQWWWETPPAAIDDSEITETHSADIIVVGVGNAGVMAMLTAVEGGASVIGIEKGSGSWCGANKMAFMSNIAITKEHGLDFTDDDRRKAIWELMKCGAERPDYRFYQQWMNDGGEFAEWMDAITQENGLAWEMHEWPYPEGYDVERENYKHYPIAVSIEPNSDFLTAVRDKATKNGAEIFTNTSAEQLVREDDNGRVTAVIAKNQNGDYVKFEGSKGIILCTGEYSADKQMVQAYCPRVYSPDAFSMTLNTGDGHRMGMWVGAQMESSPHAPLRHAFSYGLLRCSAFLHVNAYGERFHNEDVSNPLWNECVEQNPGKFAWQICDSNWQQYVPQMTPEYNSVWEVDDELIAEMESASTTPVEEEGFTGTSSNGTVRYKADTIEELAKLMGVPADTLVATVERYNEMAYKGADTDFFRGSWRMFPIDTPPYYAGKNYVSDPLLVLGGLVTDPITMQALDAEGRRIRGLYLAGNVVGRKFNVYYPGLAAGLALANNRLNGWRAGKCALEDDGGSDGGEAIPGRVLSAPTMPGGPTAGAEGASGEAPEDAPEGAPEGAAPQSS